MSSSFTLIIRSCLGMAFASLLALGIPYGATANIVLPAIISDNMVLQQTENPKLWGTASPAEEITVKFQNHKVITTADADGNWMVELKKPKRGNSFDLTFTGSNELVVHNVAVGEVWLCSGQSNMEMQLGRVNNAAEEAAQATDPDIRLFLVKRDCSHVPLKDLKGKWEVCSPEAVCRFSAAGYFFGKEIHEALSKPIGLIDSSVGGTPAEAWISLPSLKREPQLQDVFSRWNSTLAQFKSTLPEWIASEFKKNNMPIAMRNGKVYVSQKAKRFALANYKNDHEPASLYNAMINPLTNYSIRGVLWYQGEENTHHPEDYRALLSTLISDWRTQWQSDFPFIYVQLAGFGKAKADDGWPLVREAQLECLSFPNTAMVVAIDIGDKISIHPRNKQGIGKRLALAALAKAYGKNVVYSGPIFKSMSVYRNAALLRFDHSEGGLRPSDGNELKGFVIAGSDGTFYDATAKVFGSNTVTICSDMVKSPAFVKYGWANYPDCNLINEAGLPASPFRASVPGVEKSKSAPSLNPVEGQTPQTPSK